MPSEFVSSFTQPLLTSSPPSVHTTDTHDGPIPPDADADAETRRTLIKVYADALDLYLSQALHTEAEADYWAQVEGSTVALCVYYLYTHRIRLPPNPLSPFSLLRASASFSITTLRQKIKSKRKTLERIRDERAETLGTLVQLRPLLLQCPSPSDPTFIQSLHSTLVPASQTLSIQSLQSSLLTLPSTYTHVLQSQHLLRPPWHIRHLPSLLLLPPLTLYLYTAYPTLLKPHLYHLRTTTISTLRGFITNWLIDPILSILQTIRSGSSASSTLVHDQTVQADLESLEQMSISLLSSHSPLTPSQLSHISSQILTTRDITPILQIHTSTLTSPSRNPLSSLLLPPNTLLHTLLIQLQKAKVDLDFALQGISHLLKSQQLTFGFVGVSPALVLLYLFSNASLSLWKGTAGWGRWGGKHRRKRIWSRLRRIERILNAESSKKKNQKENNSLGPLPTGLMILSLTKMRTYGMVFLPGRIRELFLEDLGDLEDPMLDTGAKLRVVDRMWRCWGAGDGGEGVVINP